MIPFEKYMGLDWTCSQLVVWCIGAVWCGCWCAVGIVSIAPQVQKDVYHRCEIMAAIFGVSFFWVFSWLVIGIKQ